VGVVMTNSNDFAVAWTGQKVGSSAFPPQALGADIQVKCNKFNKPDPK
jgi:hypothetical protein